MVLRINVALLLFAGRMLRLLRLRLPDLVMMGGEAYLRMITIS